MNVKKQILKYLPDELKQIVDIVSGLSRELHTPAYMVGGIVRDMFLNVPCYDLDIVVEGDGIAFGRHLNDKVGGEITIHEKFGTVKICLDEYDIDIVTARSETYSRPGALPTVTAGTIKDDLQRRDFSVNALAVDITPAGFGGLIDVCSGYDDIERRLIRVLHVKSFIDDPTRIWRAVRYEQRYGFNMESDTLQLLKEGISGLADISSRRIRHELELILEEDTPEMALKRAGELGVLAALHPSIICDGWLFEKIMSARAMICECNIKVVYEGLLVWKLSDKAVNEFIEKVKPPKYVIDVIRQSRKLKNNISYLDKHFVRRSDIFKLLRGYDINAVAINHLTVDEKNIRGNISLYLEEMIGEAASVELNGNDITGLGVKAGPQVKKILDELLFARIDGGLKTRQEEIDFVRRFINA